MIPVSPDITTLWVSILIEELIRSGARTFVVCPGSRSTPLALAIGENAKAEVVAHFDERGAAFFALGHSRATGQPTVLVCTSGTAVANCLPAVIEAAMDNVPLIILSADRPPELHETRANQTILQDNIFADYCRWRFTIPCPDQTIPAEFVLTTIDQAIYRSRRSPAGPVHLNVQFREPLIPVLNQPVSAEYFATVKNWLGGDRAYTTYAQFEHTSTGVNFERIVKTLASKTRGLLVVGRLKQSDGETAAVIELAERLGWSVVTDILSGLRLGGIPSTTHLPHFDLCLLDQSSAMSFDCILHLGGTLVSKRISQFVASQTADYFIVNDHPDRQDIGHRVTTRIESDIETFARTICARLPKCKAVSPEHSLVTINYAVGEVLAKVLDNTNYLCEPIVPCIIAQEIVTEHSLVIASSLPIRDFDMYAQAGNSPALIACNRGASGIDGTLATAVGVAHGRKQPTTLVIGDLAMLHDLNSLALLRTSGLPPITIVIINNGGGAIFSLLPVAYIESKSVGSESGTDTFEKLFLQGHDLKFEEAAKMFSVKYHNPATIKDFRDIYRNAVRNSESTIIELTFGWRESRRIRGQLQDRIVTRLKQV